MSRAEKTAWKQKNNIIDLLRSAPKAEQSVILSLLHVPRSMVINKPLLIVSDIDDTLYPSLFDCSGERKVPYEGMVDLLTSCPSVCFVTAQHPLISFFTNVKQSVKHYIPDSHIILSDRICLTKRAIIKSKIKTLDIIGKLYNEFDIVLIGDSGQYDVVAYQFFQKAYPKQTKAVFIRTIRDKYNEPIIMCPDISFPSLYRIEHTSEIFKKM